MRLMVIGIAAGLMAVLSGCGSINATMRNAAGEDVMLLGHDPVAYFTQSKPLRGDPAIKSTLPGRTYYFLNSENKRAFDANPGQFEPQFGGFCSSGAAFGIKLGSDPTEWKIVSGKLYIFGDVLGRTAWELDPQWNIRHAEQVWPEAKDVGWRWQSLKRYANKVSWYKSGADIKREFDAKYPGVARIHYDVGGMFTNLFLKSPGWRAREGYGGQPAVGLVGEDPCPVTCVGAESKAFRQ